MEPKDIIEATTSIVTAYAAANRCTVEELQKAITTTYGTLTALSTTTVVQDAIEAAESEANPATTVRKSLASPDFIISMIDGKPYKTLRRHLATHGLTPEEYRARYNLKPDYPMVAKTYSESRRAMAKKIGLGRKPGEKPGTLS